MSLKVVPFKSLGAVSYSPSAVTMAVTDGRTDRIAISILRVSSRMLTRDKNWPFRYINVTNRRTPHDSKVRAMGCLWMLTFMHSVITLLFE